MMRYLTALVVTAALLAGGAARADDSKIQPYPKDAVKNLYDGCMKSKDLAKDKAKPVCTCYAVMVQGTIPYSVFTKTSAEIKAKGFDGLDADGKAAMEKNGYDVSYCRLKHQAVGTAEERATFPKAALPALHESCMSFQDIAADRKEKFCGCYEELIQTQVSFSEWQLLSLAIETKGRDQLDGEETHTFDIVRQARERCGGAPAK